MDRKVLSLRAKLCDYQQNIQEELKESTEKHEPVIDVNLSRSQRSVESVKEKKNMLMSHNLGQDNIQPNSNIALQNNEEQK